MMKSFDVSLLLDPIPRVRELERQLGLLMRLYLRKRSPTRAALVVEHIEALLVHPDLDVPFEQRCRLRCLAAHWRCRAWLDEGLVTRPKGSTELHDRADETTPCE